jgi:hypothetical protein
MASAPIAASSSGQNQIIPAPTNRKSFLRIHGLAIVCAGSVTVTLQSGNNNLSGPMSFSASTGIMSSFGEDGYLETNPGEDFNINLGSGTAVAGWVTYSVRGG